VAPDPGSIPQTAPLIVVGSVAQIVGREGPRFSADKDRVERFNKLVPEMMYTAVRPYLGEEAAKRELTIPPPEAELASRAGECNCPHLRHTVEAVNTPQEPREGSRGLPRLPPGRHGLSREFVVENQRQRLAAGMIQAVAKRGYNSATVSDIAAASGVSRRSFYGYFDSKEECFSDTYAMVADFLFGVMAEAGESERGWPARVRAELTAMLEVFAANPDLASFSLIAPSAAGGTVAERYRDFLGRLVAVLGEGRPQNARRPSEAAEHGLVGGLAGLVVEQVKAGQGKNLSALLPDLLELVLTPYLGRAKAVKEARRK
jgi:AcrR family transcriptional regulator